MISPIKSIVIESYKKIMELNKNSNENIRLVVKKVVLTK